MLRTHRHRRLLPTLGASAIVLAASAAYAFPYGYSWNEPAHSGTAAPDTPAGRAGAGGIYYTGSQADYGMSCATCHIGAAGKISGKVSVSPPFKQKNGMSAFEPGTAYTITIDMLNEQKLPAGPVKSTMNGVNAAIVDPGGKLQGVLSGDVPGNSGSNCPSSFPKPKPTTGTTFVYGDCRAVIFAGKEDITSWTFKWTAPTAASVSQVTLYYSMVDGDTSGNSSDNDDVYSNKMDIVRY